MYSSECKRADALDMINLVDDTSRLLNDINDDVKPIDSKTLEATRNSHDEVINSKEPPITPTNRRYYNDYTGETINIVNIKNAYIDHTRTLKFADVYSPIFSEFFSKMSFNDPNYPIFNNIDTLDGFFEPNEQYGKNVHNISQLPDIEQRLHQLLENLTADRLCSSDDVKPLTNEQCQKETDYFKEEMNREYANPFYALLRHLTNYSAYDEKITLSKADAKIHMSRVMLIKIIILKVLGSFILLTYAKDSNAYMKYGNGEEFQINATEKTIRKLNSLELRYLNIHQMEKFTYDQITDQTKRFIRNFTFNMLYEAILEYDMRNFGRNYIQMPLNIYHEGFICGLIAFTNGYRAILFNHFSKICRKYAYTGLIDEYINQQGDRVAFIRSLIESAFNDQNNYIRKILKHDVEYKNLSNTLNDSRFLLLVVSSFLNLPAITTLNMIYFTTRFSYSSLRHLYIDGDGYRVYSMGAMRINFYRLSCLVDGYVFPCNPYIEDYYIDFPDFKEHDILASIITGEAKLEDFGINESADEWINTNQLQAMLNENVKLYDLFIKQLVYETKIPSAYEYIKSCELYGYEAHYASLFMSFRPYVVIRGRPEIIKPDSIIVNISSYIRNRLGVNKLLPEHSEDIKRILIDMKTYIVNNFPWLDISTLIGIIHQHIMTNLEQLNILMKNNVDLSIQHKHIDTNYVSSVKSRYEQNDKGAWVKLDKPKIIHRIRSIPWMENKLISVIDYMPSQSEEYELFPSRVIYFDNFNITMLLPAIKFITQFTDHEDLNRTNEARTVFNNLFIGGSKRWNIILFGLLSVLVAVVIVVVISLMVSDNTKSDETKNPSHIQKAL